MRIYVDTNVYSDYLLIRKNKCGVDLSLPAFGIFQNTVNGKHQIIVSDHLLNELHFFLEPDDSRSLFTFLRKKIIKTESNARDKQDASALPTSPADALHIVLAKKALADCIITRNISDFQGLFKAKLPEDV